MYHPWRRLRSLTDWTLQWQRSEIVDGVTHFPTKTVTLDPRLLQVERRCTIAHEIVHIERGPLSAQPWFAGREESAVEREVARRLITLHDLGEALAWARHRSEAADLLWVTDDVLQVRLEHLHPSERAYLRERMAHRHECEEVA